MIEVTRDKLEDMLQRVADLVMKKNHDYGDAWQKQGMPGVCARLSDKLCRIEVLTDGAEVLVAGEDLDATLVDAIGYSLLGLLYHEEMQRTDIDFHV